MKPKAGPFDATYLRSLYEYNPDTGLFRWRKLGWNRRSGWFNGDGHSSGYRLLKVDRKSYWAHRLAWLYCHGEWPLGELDHANGDKSDNRLSNIRRATTSQNCANRPSRSVPGRRGVYQVPGSHNRWQARIYVNRKMIRLGIFNTPEEAHAAYLAGARKHFGDFARAV